MTIQKREGKEKEGRKHELTNDQRLGGIYNTHEGENFVPSGLSHASSTGTPPFNSSAESFDNWLSGFMPGLSEADREEAKNLYPQAGSSEAIASYNGSYVRAALIYRDSVLACPAYWMAGAAPEGSYLGEYSISPAKHGSDTIYVRLPPLYEYMGLESSPRSREEILLVS
jgi:hypothetical protein